MLSVADTRAFSSPEERFQHCACCGKELVVLPQDRRGGFCHDCLSLVGPAPTQCPSCGVRMDASDHREAECLWCGWSPHQP